MTEPEGDDEGLLILPAFEAGGRVERTGIALVHEGEYIVTAAGSEAVIGPAASSQQVVWTFPVEVEVVGEPTAAQIGAVTKQVFDELDMALRRRTGG